MPFIPLPECAKVAITFQNAQGNQAVNTFWFYDANGDLTLSRAQTLTSAMADWLQTDWADVAVADWKAVRCETRGWNAVEAAYDDELLDIPGTLTGDALPSEVTIAISLRTGFTGRSKRGRIFHVGIGETNVIGDMISDAYKNNLVTAYAGLKTITDPLDFTWVVASFQTEGAPRAQGVYTPITSIVIVDNIVDSQRKRKPSAY